MKNSFKSKLKLIAYSMFVGAFVLFTFKYINTKIPVNPQSDVILKYSRSHLINLNELFEYGSCLLREAGKKIVEIRKESSKLEFNRKEKDNSIVTVADFESHKIIVHSLEDKYEHLTIKSEENSQKDDKFDVNIYRSRCDTYEKKTTDLYVPISDVTVYIDPLDATQEYSENLVEFVTVMFCIVLKDVPRAGIIYKPFKNSTCKQTFQSLIILINITLTWFVFLNLKVMSFMENKKPSENIENKNRIIVSRSHSGSVKEIIDAKLPNAQMIIAGGSGYKTTSLFENQADLYLHSSKIYKWDVCAPNAILNNNGGKLTKRNGEIISYKDETESVPGIIASLNNYEHFFKIFST